MNEVINKSNLIYMAKLLYIFFYSDFFLTQFLANLSLSLLVVQELLTSGK